jgi:radical SAM superfamily enzyme YgiQ (UPF0313 family)
MNKILFITFNLNPHINKFNINHAIPMFVPIIKKENWNVELITIYNISELDNINKRIYKIKPDVIGYSCTYFDIEYVKKIANSNIKYFQIAGGIGPTIAPDVFLDINGLNGVCVGEGEIPLQNLIKKLNNNESYLNIKSFFWKNNVTIIRNKLNSVNDLDSLELPDYSIYKTDDNINQNNIFSVIISRGCPFSCNHCATPTIKKMFGNEYFRFYSPDKSILILKQLLKTFSSIKKINFQDDVLTMNKKWFIKFSELYKNEINLPYYAQTRPKMVTDLICKNLKDSGCEMIFIGVESGNEKLRKEILNRTETNNEIINAVKKIHKFKLKSYLLFMIGLPTETKKNMRESFKLIKKIKPHDGFMTMYRPVINSELYNLCQKNELLIDKKDLTEKSIICPWDFGPYIKMDNKLKWYCVGYKNKILHYFFYKRALNENKYKQAIKHFVSVYLNPFLSQFFKFQSAFAGNYLKYIFGIKKH